MLEVFVSLQVIFAIARFLQKSPAVIDIRRFQRRSKKGRSTACYVPFFCCMLCYYSLIVSLKISATVGCGNTTFLSCSIVMPASMATHAVEINSDAGLPMRCAPIT